MGDLSKILDFAGQGALPLIFWFCIFFLIQSTIFTCFAYQQIFRQKDEKVYVWSSGVCVTTILELNYCAGCFCVNTQLETCLSSFPVSQNRDLKYQTGSLPFEIVNRHWSWEILDGVEKVYRKIQRYTYLCPNALISQLIAIYQFDEELQLKKKQVKTLMRFEARPLPPGEWSNP